MTNTDGTIEVQLHDGPKLRFGAGSWEVDDMGQLHLPDDATFPPGAWDGVWRVEAPKPDAMTYIAHLPEHCCAIQAAAGGFRKQR